jgi:hypothetical protein
VNPKLRARGLVALVAVVCGVSIGAVVWYRSRTITPAALLRRIPSQNSLVLYVDFNALRHAGVLQMLQQSKVDLDPSYQVFMRKTGFDYLQDLDSAMVAFSPTGKFVYAKGRFDWSSLHSYVEGEGGQCYNSLCRMAGSTPERQISFLPVQTDLMGLAVSPDNTAALRLTNSGVGPELEVPDTPVWLSIPAAVLQSRENLPAGTQMFAHSLDQAESATLAFASEGNRFAAKLNVRCRNEQDAAQVAAQLIHITSLLRDLIQREHQVPNPRDLSGVLTSGSFRAEGRRVFGYWPIERAFLENILGGGS